MVTAAQVAASESAGEHPATMLVLGDSISAALGMDLEQGWVALLEARLKARSEGYKVINASISGDTTAGGLRRLPRLLETTEPDVLIIELGGNDGLRGYPIPQMRDNLTRMTRQGQAAGAEVILLAMEIPPNFGRRYTTLFRESYSVVAEATGALYAPFVLDGVATASNLMQGDGIHPTIAAQPVLLENIWPYLEPLITAAGDD